MNHSNSVKAANLKPFKKGEDKRRNTTSGPLKKEAIAFAIKFKNALVEHGNPNELAEILWNEARKKKPWAIEMILDRMMGKSTQPIEHKTPIPVILSDKFLPKDNGRAKSE